MCLNSPPPYDLLNSEVIFNSLKGLSHNSFPITFGPAVLNREALSHCIPNISNAITIDTQTYCTCVYVCSVLRKRTTQHYNKRLLCCLMTTSESTVIFTCMESVLKSKLPYRHTTAPQFQKLPQPLAKPTTNPWVSLQDRVPAWEWGKTVHCNEETQVKAARGSVHEGDSEVELHTQNGSKCLPWWKKPMEPFEAGCPLIRSTMLRCNCPIWETFI